jgi:hypothetical protein
MRGQAAAKRETDSVSPAPSLEVGETGSRKKRLARLPASCVVAVFDEFLYAVEHPEAGEPHAVRLVDEVAPTPGWTPKQLPRRAPTRAIAEGRGVRVCVDESRPAARADLTSSLTARSQRKGRGPVAHAGPLASETPRRRNLAPRLERGGAVQT